MRPILHDARLGDPRLVGHKFARQESLRRAGFRVPEFFCLPAEVFDAVAGPVLADLWPSAPDGVEDRDGAGDGDLAARALAVRDAILGTELPAALVRSVLAAFDDLVGPGGLAAVRACVVADAEGEGEDGAGDPFAGLSDSFLYVPRGLLADRIVRCLASAFNPEAVLYRTRRGVDPASARVAVGVQLMIAGTRSFVAFTRDPRDGAARTVIAAAYGIGEGVVQEKADLDHFFVAHHTGAIIRAVTHKTRMIALDPGRPESGPVTLDVPGELAAAPVLDDAAVRRVHDLARAVARHFGEPQDIEGTITPDGTVHLLQARPLVAAAPAAPPVAWTNHNLTESYPGVSGALTFSLAREFYEGTFTDFYRRMGVPPRVLRRERHHLRHMIGSLDGRLYYRLDAWYAMHGRLPGFELFRHKWEDGLGLPEHHRTTEPPAPGAWRRALRSAPQLAVTLARHPASVRDFLGWWDELAARRDRLDGQSPEDLLAYYRWMWAEAAVRWGVTLTVGYFLLLAMNTLTALMARWTPDGPEQRGLVPALLCGGPENRSVAAMRSAIALAERIRQDPRLRDAVLGADEHEVWQDLMAGRYGTGIAAAVRQHLTAYGDRALHDLKLEAPTPRQRPWTLLSTLRPLVAQDDLTVAASRAEERRIRGEAEAQLRTACPNPVKRAVLRTAAAATRWSVRARENTRFCRSQLYGISRQILWRLGEVLATEDRLDRADDIVDLTVDEVTGAFDGTLHGNDLRALAERRRAERILAGQRPALPAYLLLSARRPVAAALAAALADVDLAAGSVPESGRGAVLTGLASSTGRVRARAKIVLDPRTSPDACRGRILVARETDPGWLFLMLSAKALVVERGTLVSHTAISGRLLGIPTVVAVDAATTRIPDGALIEVDGGAGTVRILDREGGGHAAGGLAVTPAYSNPAHSNEAARTDEEDFP